MAAPGRKPESRCRVVVLISGRGSNLQAIVDAARAAGSPVDVCGVVSNRAEAPGLDIARNAGVPVAVVDHRDFPDRASFDRALIAEIDAHRPDLVALAGFLRILGPAFIDHYAGRLMNIHPSLLPAFPGLRTHERALAAGAKRHGATVHFVTRDVDGGPAIIQAAVPVLSDDTPQSLAERVLRQEHRIYPIAIRWFAESRLDLRDGSVLVNGRRDPMQGLASDSRTQENAGELTP